MFPGEHHILDISELTYKNLHGKSVFDYLNKKQTIDDILSYLYYLSSGQRGGGGVVSGFWRDRIVFRGKRRRKVGRRLQSVERVPRKLLPMWEIIGILQSFMGGSGEHNQSLPTTPLPPSSLSPHQNPGPLNTQEKIIMITKKIEIHEIIITCHRIYSQ